MFRSVVVGLLWGTVASAVMGNDGTLSLADFLPKNFVVDGSVSYQAEIQKAIDTAAASGRPACLPAYGRTAR